MAAKRWLAVFLLSTLTAAAAAAQVTPMRDSGPRRGSGRVTPATFEQVFVIDRSLAELAIWELLVELTSTAGFTPIVVYGGGRDGELSHLLEIVPPGTSFWVSADSPPEQLAVDYAVQPAEILGEALSETVVVSLDESLDDLAALIAMRLDASLLIEAPSSAERIVQVGGGESLEGSYPDVDDYTYLEGPTEALHYANTLATHPVVMMTPDGGLAPEFVLYAFQRDAMVVEVSVDPFDNLDAESEYDAVMAVKAQLMLAIHELPLPGGTLPSTLVVAGGWDEIPYRFVRSTDPLFECSSCDNGYYEFSADVEYANFDSDSWGEPDAAVGRLMSYDPDLLGLQTVVGVWRDQGAFPEGQTGSYLEVLTTSSLRDAVYDAWRDAASDRSWTLVGPEDDEQAAQYSFDPDEFFAGADLGDLVLVHAHGSEHELSGENALFGGNHDVRLRGEDIAASGQRANPAFWFIQACATARHLDPRQHTASTRKANYSLVSAVQSRLGLGALMAVDTVSTASASLYWPGSAYQPGLSVGELVRRGFSAAITAYRTDNGDAFPVGLARPTGQELRDQKNAWVQLFWIGDPLTEM